MHLNSRDLKRLNDFYVRALKEYGDHDARSLNWIDKHNQFLRFEVLLQVASIKNKKILDVGCGFGDLCKLIQEKKIPVSYTGIDIIPEYIEMAKKNFPGVYFECTDIFDMNDENKFDIVLASGALSFKVEDNEKYYEEMIRKMYSLATEAVAFNMLNNDTHINDETFAAYSPHTIGNFCKTFCDRAEIVTGYLAQDFTVYLYK